MSGCGTSLKGRAVVEVRESSMSVSDYDHWVRNYIALQQGVAEGRYTPEQVDISGCELYLKDAGDTALTQVELYAATKDDGTVRVTWTAWSYYDDCEFTYKDGNNGVLAFEYDPYEGLDRYTLTIVPRESADEPMPEGWNGTFIFDQDCPLRGRSFWNFWSWADSYSIIVGVSADVLVTPYGEESGVKNPIATREIAVKTG